MTATIGTADPGISPSAIAAWEFSPRPIAETAPMLTVDGFAGPLDWLLELVRTGKIDLTRLSIVALVEAFATALDAALVGGENQLAVPLARWGDWLVMAATLALLRSRLLLPAGTPEALDAAEAAAALRDQLLGRAQIAAAADWLEARPLLGREVFPRGGDVAEAPNRSGDLSELLRACLVVLHLPDNVEVFRPRPPPLWSATDAIARVRRLIDRLPTGAALPEFLPTIASDAPTRERRCRAAVASTLVAGLELARSGTLTLTQAAIDAPIHLTAIAAAPT